MLAMYLRSSLVLLFLLCGFIRPARDPSLNGQLNTNPKVAAAVIPAGLRILVKSDGRILGQTSALSSGRFQLTFTAPVMPADTVYDFFCLAPGLDTLYLKTIASASAASSIIQLLFPCAPDTTSGGDILCPKCRKEDQIYPMVYGDPIVITRHLDTSGKTSYERTPGKKGNDRYTDKGCPLLLPPG